MLPPPHEAAAWFVETVRAVVRSGGRVDEGAVRLLMRLVPGDPLVEAAIEHAAPDALQDISPIVQAARTASAELQAAVAARDEPLARSAVTRLETEILNVYRPGYGLGGFEEDVAVALAMLDAYDVGADEAHVMMAEELLRGALRRYWPSRTRWGISLHCEAAVALARLAASRNDPAYREQAMDLMCAYAAGYRELGLGAAPYVSALHLLG